MSNLDSEGLGWAPADNSHSGHVPEDEHETEFLVKHVPLRSTDKLSFRSLDLIAISREDSQSGGSYVRPWHYPGRLAFISTRPVCHSLRLAEDSPSIDIKPRSEDHERHVLFARDPMHHVSHRNPLVKPDPLAPLSLLTGVT